MVRCAFNSPYKLRDTLSELGSQTRWQVVPHAFDQHLFCAGNGFRCRSPATDIAHAVSKPVDHEGGDLDMP